MNFKDWLRTSKCLYLARHSGSYFQRIRARPLSYGAMQLIGGNNEFRVRYLQEKPKFWYAITYYTLRHLTAAKHVFVIRNLTFCLLDFNKLTSTDIIIKVP